MMTNWSSKYQITYALVLKRQLRLKRGQQLISVVLERGDKRLDEPDELEILIAKINCNRNKFQKQIHFQIALNTERHWTAIDFTISKDQLKIFVIDAVDNTSGKDAENCLANQLKGAEVYYLESKLSKKIGKLSNSHLLDILPSLKILNNIDENTLKHLITIIKTYNLIEDNKSTILTTSQTSKN